MIKHKSGRLLTQEEIRRRNVERIMNPPRRSLWDRMMGGKLAIEEWWCRHFTQRDLYRQLDSWRALFDSRLALPTPIGRPAFDIETALLNLASSHMEPSGGCQESIETPQLIINLAEDVPGEKWMGVSRHPTCVLDFHEAESDHWACILNLTGDDAIWAHWADGELPTDIVVLKDCPVLRESDGSGCCGFVGHPGRHSWEF